MMLRIHLATRRQKSDMIGWPTVPHSYRPINLGTEESGCEQANGGGPSGG